MFEDERERRQKITYVHNQVLQYLQLDSINVLKVFYNKDSMRLKKLAYKNLKKAKKFYEIKIRTDSFKSQDLVKISKLNNDIFYIDLKNIKIYTCDQQFAQWCALTDGDINSIRYSV